MDFTEDAITYRKSLVTSYCSNDKLNFGLIAVICFYTGYSLQNLNLEKTKNLEVSIAWIRARCWHPKGPYLSSLDIRPTFLHSLEPHKYLDTIKVVNYVLQWCSFVWNTDILLIQMESQLDSLKIKLAMYLFVQLNIYNFIFYKCCLFRMQLNFASYENSYSLHTNDAFHLINFLARSSN